MSDRVAVMSRGRVEQIGTPAGDLRGARDGVRRRLPGDLEPDDGDVVGESAGPGPGCTVAIGDFRLTAGCGDITARGPVKVVARPERLTLLEHGSVADNTLPGMVERTVYVGSNLQVMVRLATGVQLQASITNTGQATGMEQGTPVAVQIPADALRVLRHDTGVYTPERRPPLPKCQTHSGWLPSAAGQIDRRDDRRDHQYGQQQQQQRVDARAATSAAVRRDRRPGVRHRHAL